MQLKRETVYCARIAAIMIRCMGAGEGLTLPEIVTFTKVPRVAAERILDVLEARNLVTKSVQDERRILASEGMELLTMMDVVFMMEGNVPLLSMFNVNPNDFVVNCSVRDFIEDGIKEILSGVFIREMFTC